MRIAFIGQPRDRVVGWGSEPSSVAIVLMALAHRLAAWHEVRVIAPRLPDQTSVEQTPSGVTVERVPADWRLGQSACEIIHGLTRATRPQFWRDDYYARFRREAVAAVARAQPEVVHVMTVAGYGPALRHASPSSYLVLHLHDATLARIPKSETARLIAPFDLVVCCSHWLAAILRKHLPERASAIHAVPNGVDTMVVPRLDQSGADPQRLLSIGRISVEKGPHVLLAAFARLADRFPTLHVDFVGTPGLLPLALQRLLLEPVAAAAALSFYGKGLADRLDRQLLRPIRRLQGSLLDLVPANHRHRVHFHGSVPHDRLIEYLSTATLFIQASVCSEGFGLPLAEAMAAGLAPIASEVGALTDLVEHGVSGLLVMPGDAAALADAIEHLLHSPAERERLGTAAAERIAHSFRWDDSAMKLDTLYGSGSAAAAA